ncbi:hypothetical protein O181_016560 [Austropuccinia psidii MF-1]|uniref:Uncharacterized protein n=1 Tax=Austropuccinia psidii MF-1 TaxID=1389203 RepID=A0A9Q3GS38_9BASI|nr:hypothetical protein [Austropuccinia psidii MF-1]
MGPTDYATATKAKIDQTGFVSELTNDAWLLASSRRSCHDINVQSVTNLAKPQTKAGSRVLVQFLLK